MFAVERDTQIAAHRDVLHERSQPLANVPVGSRAHARLLAECEDISDEIERLKRCISIPRAALAALLVALLLLALLLLG
ncbi:hypothetical protein [Kitasatospora sp. DSM 101779]|uniref:hypothetical protein n=1 Tax=Kitasatospora sp. DSM 101779 TaxID=2853165 RepID=UPI0021DAB6A4|nr:hypothetical protein [Kitasatospora sp. DSM 101779]MCU7827283.1 hypothetical protein [Kitasatospora sp. DSM 101779]